MANRETAFIEITPEVLLKAYACGIFPMAESAEDPALYWVEPDMRGIVPRATTVRLQALDREGNPVDVVAKEFFARVIQHETDHLHGRVYLDRMRDFSTLTHLAEWNRYWLGNQEQDD